MKIFKLTLTIPLILLLFWSFGAISLHSDTQPDKNPAKEKFDPSLLKAMRWRHIGPFLGGRATAVAGVPGSSQPFTYYFGAAGGGVWKTEDGGLNWRNISDGYFTTGEVGCIAVSKINPNIIYVGMGGQWIRENVSHGDGIYKSTDAGKTWEHVWKVPFSQIVKIRIHPQNPDLLFAAVFGRVYGPSKERGVFRSKDGGMTWEKILFRDSKTGAIDLILDPSNPNIIYASLWEAHCTPHGMISGGPGSGLFKSTDGGDTWEDISRNKGLPQGLLGKIGITVSPVAPNRIWAMIEAEDIGVFHSADRGVSWQKVSDECALMYRPWSYFRIYSDPKDEETLYVTSQRFWRSKDGGLTWDEVPTPHVDNHDLWIDPENPKRMINANDGGANISINGGLTWSKQDNQPTLQFYHVITDNQKPYRIYGSAQDHNYTFCMASRTHWPGGIGKRDYYSVGGCETGHIAPHPMDPDIVYATCCGISVTRWDRKGPYPVVREILPWPRDPVGYGADALKYRFQWDTPIMISKFEPYPVYVGANVVFKTLNEGQSWEVISPDLTTDDKSKQVAAGGPITKDNTPSYYYCTIYAMAESFHDPDILWIGSNDGLVHITTDGGNTWENVTPKQMRRWSNIRSIEPSKFDRGTAYLAVDPHKLDDFRPDVYKTNDYGKSWTKIINGLPDNTFVRVVREDPKRKGLLYAGTETGVFVSFDDGANWQSLQLNLPLVPIHDLAVKDGDLIAATHGRSFWILDDIYPLRQITDETAKADFFLFRPGNAFRIAVDKTYDYPREELGENPPNGSIIYYFFKERPNTEVLMEFMDAQGKLIKKFSSKTEEQPEGESQAIPVEAGLNRFVWDMCYPGARRISGSAYDSYAPPLSPPVAVPGTYMVKLTVGAKSMTRSWKWKAYPGIPTTQEEFQEQFDLLVRIRDMVDEVNKAIGFLRNMKVQIDNLLEHVQGHAESKQILESALRLKKKAHSVESELIQPKIKCPERWLEFPSKLNSLLISLSSTVKKTDAPPTDESYDVFNKLSEETNEQLEKLSAIVNTDVSAFNKLLDEAGLSAFLIKARYPCK